MLGKPADSHVFRHGPSKKQKARRLKARQAMLGSVTGLMGSPFVLPLYLDKEKETVSAVVLAGSLLETQSAQDRHGKEC
jgi:hypothetical protein